MAQCFICRNVADREAVGDGHRVSCPLCGQYRISATLSSTFASADTFADEHAFADAKVLASDERLRPYLSAYVKHANVSGGQPFLTSDTWRAYAEAHAHTSVSRKLDMLLRVYEQGSEHPGATIQDRADTFALIDARNVAELKYLRVCLIEQHLLKKNDAGGGYRLTAQGWERLMPASQGGIPGTCFVAMSFDTAFDAAYEQGILPAVEQDCLFRVIRVDRTSHNDQITDRIISGIRSAQFVVADFTRQRPNVYYEAGVAWGLGRTVIRTCREDEYDNLHFDTRQFHHLRWTSASDLRTALADHIKATIGVYGGR